MKFYKILSLGLAALFLAGLPGCSLFSSPASQEPGATFFANADSEELNVSRYTPDSLANYKQGRDYAAAGRFELAREHYLLALAAANTQDLQDALVAELNSVDMMIKSLR